MPQPTAVLLVVGLNQSLIGDWSPRIQAFARDRAVRPMTPVLPAVTCAVQSSMLTGKSPREHGIVGNGWFDRTMNEVQFWKQSNPLVQGEKVWESARRRDPTVTTLNMFWWYNMYSSADWSVTPRPMYKADGRKIPDCYGEPPELRDELQAKLGRFPLFSFWGPASSIASSRWIADATMLAHAKHQPTLTLVYLPHLDYPLQKLGPDDPRIRDEVASIDAVVGDLLDHFRARGVRPIIVSEYGIEPVDDAVYLNRILRREGMLRVRQEEGLELLDAGASLAFAVADHQIAHIYVKRAEDVAKMRELIEAVPGVDRVLDRDAQREHGLDHERSGELVAIAEPRRWFSYYYWLDDAKAPDFARTVDIHRKPGYDPVELFLDPKLRAPKLAIASKLARRKLGFRTLLDVIPLDGSLVRGSHGRVEQEDSLRPVVIADPELAPAAERVSCTAVHDVILSSLFDEPFVEAQAARLGPSRQRIASER